MSRSCGNEGTYHNPTVRQVLNFGLPTINTGYPSNGYNMNRTSSHGSSDSGYGTRGHSVASATPLPSYPTQSYPVQASSFQTYSTQDYSSPSYFSNRQPSQQNQTYPYSDARSPSTEFIKTAPVSSSKHKRERRISPPRPSSPPVYHCLYPHCDHTSSRAHDLERHVSLHFPPKESELLDCKYKWCGRIDAHGFKEERYRIAHYRKVHVKEIEYPKTRKSRKARRSSPAVIKSHTTISTSQPSKEDKLVAIVSQVLETLVTNEEGQYCASLELQWDILGFIEDQFRDNDFPNTALGRVITISGSARHAQAATCLDYIQQNWPTYGSGILNALQVALDRVTGSYKSNFDTSVVDRNATCDSALFRYTEFDIEITQEFLFLKVKSETLVVIVDVFQQLAWMGAALRTSRDDGVQYCEPKLERIPENKEPDLAMFNITFDMWSPGEEDRSCWFPLFTNPVIAYGFPTAPRNDSEVGLEIPLDMMAVLGGARHVVDFEGGLVMKGHSAMFVPLKRYDQSIQWHLIRRSDEDRILYRELGIECPNRAMLEEVDHEALLSARAFLGWWPSSETHLGTADAAYNSIDWSPAGDAKRTTKFAGASIGFQTMVTGQLSFVPGAKDGSLHFSQKGPFQKVVQSAQKTPVLLYDPTDRRAWCVSGLELMLHIVQTRHHLIPYKIDGEKVELTPVKPENGRSAAIEAVTANQMRLLYARNIASEKIHYFQDEILDIWSRMERLMEEKNSLEASPGLTLHGTMQSKLHGWEYMSLVNEKNYKRKEVKVAKSNGGWVDLFDDIDALVLFATGFDDIIKPVSNLSNLCRHWRTLPKGKDYLAVGVPILEMLYSEAGSRLSRKHLSTSHHQWHRGSVLFEHCNDTTAFRCECDRTQQIYHQSSFKTFGHVQPPDSLEENGCVIFGQAHHPFKPPQTTARSQNTIRSVFNLSNRSSRSTMQSSGNEKYSTLPTPPSSVVSPESGENGDDATWNQERPPSPVSFTDGVVQETQPMKRCMTPPNQMPNFEKRRRLDNGGDRDDCASNTLDYHPTLGHDEISDGQSSRCPTIADASNAGCPSLDGRKAIRHKAKLENFNHRPSVSFATCSTKDVNH